MQNTDFPLRKTFEQDFINKDGQNLFTLRYRQATLDEFHEFFALSSTERLLELYKMIREQIPMTIFERFMRLIFKNYRGKIERSLDVEKMCVNVLENRFRIYESVFKKVEHLETEETKKEETKSLFSSNLSIICQKYCINPVDLFKNFTLEQFMWLQDGVIFSMNAWDKDWQLKNKMALVDKDDVKARAAETRKYFEELESKQKK